jgi:hypothetical protein
MPSTADDAAMTDTKAIIDQYNAAFLERAPEKLVDLIADDCVMEGTGPAPDGNRWTGYDECLAGWQGLASDPAISSRSSTSTSTVTEPSSAGESHRHRKLPGREPHARPGREDHRGARVRQATLGGWIGQLTSRPCDDR